MLIDTGGKGSRYRQVLALPRAMDGVIGGGDFVARSPAE
jgi:hypothetical protein